jgi:hypothetical protein
MAKWDLSKLPEGRKPLEDAWFVERAQMQERLDNLIAGAETVLEEWDRGDERAFREAIEEMRSDVAAAKGEK